MSSLIKKEIYNEVARRVDTSRTSISVSETYRVVKVLVDYVKELTEQGHTLDEVIEVLGKETE